MHTTDRIGSLLSVTTPMTPPQWALLERELIKASARACEQFYEKYFDERGYLECVPRWGGDDGPDDAAENQLEWTMLHALGAPDVILDLFKRGWEGHLRQYTEEKTVEVPFARDGMYFKEFPVMFDWMHHGEGYSAFDLQCLSDPYDGTLIERMGQYAAMYMGDDRLADNYDKDNRLIRSMFNGSRGPMLRKATGLDWAGDPIDIEGRFDPGHGERNFQEMLDHFKDYNDVAGDHPLNLGATTLALNAYMLTEDKRYRDWILEYVDAWVERTDANGGLIPTNVGLDGTAGGECDGRWWGGVYGWGFTVVVPQTGELAHRPSFQGRYPYGFGNALLLTGDQKYVDLIRRVNEIVNSNSKQENGEPLYPHMYGDDGWYDFTSERFSPGDLEVYFWSMDDKDAELVAGDEWVSYLRGGNPDFPVAALERDLETVRHRIEGVRQDKSTPDTRMSDDMNGLNPAITDALTNLMLGGLPTGRVGYALHSRVRYFDPKERRAGIPEDVAALVDRMDATETSLTLVNTNQVETRTVVVQGGAYGEHQVKTVELDGVSTGVDRSHFAVRLEPGCGTRLTITADRYVNQPTCAFPWV